MSVPGPGRDRANGAPALRGLVLTGLAVVLAVVGLQILDDSGGDTVVIAPTATSSVTSSTAAAATTTTTRSTVTTTTAKAVTTTTVHKPSQVRVKVYNASDIQGQAPQSPANLTPVRTGKFVECRSTFEKDAASLATAVGTGTTVVAFPSSPPAGSSDADCLVILGKTT
jgi:hypothetical protein